MDDDQLFTVYDSPFRIAADAIDNTHGPGNIAVIVTGHDEEALFNEVFERLRCSRDTNGHLCFGRYVFIIVYAFNYMVNFVGRTYSHVYMSERAYTRIPEEELLKITRRIRLNHEESR